MCQFKCKWQKVEMIVKVNRIYQGAELYIYNQVQANWLVWSAFELDIRTSMRQCMYFK